MAEFCGSERTVAGYLLAEVLERQPPEVRELLLRTSILERVSGPLADALTGGKGSEAILQRLEDANAFVTALDVGRTWFRYHHLLSDLLQLELRRASPALIASLHRAAAQWLDEHGHVVEAIRHAQSAGDWAHAARLLTDNYVDLVFDGRKATLRALLTAFPADASQADAELALAFATADSMTASSTRFRRTSPWPSVWSRRCPASGGGSSTCGSPAPGSGSRASAAISTRRGRPWGPCRRRRPPWAGGVPMIIGRRGS